MSPDYVARFAGIGRLYGRPALARLHDAHVCVVGLGGVGSWTVEALARSGVGRLTLVDMDEVCVSNTNRQLHATASTGGKFKADVLAARVLDINPECRVKAVNRFFTASSVAEILDADRPDRLVDAIDGVKNKALLVASCRERGIPVVVSGGCAGKRDGTAVRTADLAATGHDPLLKFVRKKLRQEHGFEKGNKVDFGIPCVFSTEPSTMPDGLCEGLPGAPSGEDMTPNCEWGYGTATFVTGAFGFAAAGLVVQAIAQAEPVDAALP